MASVAEAQSPTTKTNTNIQSHVEDVDIERMAQSMGRDEPTLFHGATDSLRDELMRRITTCNKQITDLDDEIETLIDHRRNHILTLDIINATVTMIDNKVKPNS